MALGYSRVVALGNLVRDPELRTIGSGTSVCDFTIAVTTRRKKGEDETEFIDCTAWAQAGETIAQFMSKGKALLVDGYLKQENWQDKDGNKRSKFKVIVDKFTFVGGKGDGDSKPSAPKPTESMDCESDCPF